MYTRLNTSINTVFRNVSCRPPNQQPTTNMPTNVSVNAIQKQGVFQSSMDSEDGGGEKIQHIVQNLANNRPPS